MLIYLFLRCMKVKHFSYHSLQKVELCSCWKFFFFFFSIAVKKCPLAWAFELLFSSAGGRGETESSDVEGRRIVRYPDSHQLFVGNLPHDIDESELKDFFMSTFSP